MSRKEVPRAGLVKAALAGRITNQQGATALRLSVRQFQRLRHRFRHGGAPALLHRARGQPSRRRLPAGVRQRVAELLRTTYVGFNDCHLTEKLQEVHRLPVSRVSVHRIRRALGVALLLVCATRVPEVNELGRHYMPLFRAPTRELSRIR